MARTINDVNSKDLTERNCAKRRLANVSDPVNEMDAVNKQWLKRNTIEDTVDGWKCKQRRLIDVGNPVDNQDAVNKQTLVTELDKKSLTLIKA